MIQRKQTIYLLLALIATIACLCLPVGVYKPTGMGLDLIMNNLWTAGEPLVRYNFILFILLLLSCPLIVIAIFTYKNRKLQARLCIGVMLLTACWIVAYVIYNYIIGVEHYFFRPFFAACLPVVSLIFSWLAYKGIMYDERLIRSADRIR